MPPNKPASRPNTHKNQEPLILPGEDPERFIKMQKEWEQSEEKRYAHSELAKLMDRVLQQDVEKLRKELGGPMTPEEKRALQQKEDDAREFLMKELAESDTRMQGELLLYLENLIKKGSISAQRCVQLHHLGVRMDALGGALMKVDPKEMEHVMDSAWFQKMKAKIGTCSFLSASSIAHPDRDRYLRPGYTDFISHLLQTDFHWNLSHVDSSIDEAFSEWELTTTERSRIMKRALVVMNLLNLPSSEADLHEHNLVQLMKLARTHLPEEAVQAKEEDKLKQLLFAPDRNQESEMAQPETLSYLSEQLGIVNPFALPPEKLRFYDQILSSEEYQKADAAVGNPLFLWRALQGACRKDVIPWNQEGWKGILTPGEGVRSIGSILRFRGLECALLLHPNNLQNALKTYAILGPLGHLANRTPQQALDLSTRVQDTCTLAQLDYEQQALHVKIVMGRSPRYRYLTRARNGASREQRTANLWLLITTTIPDQSKISFKDTDRFMEHRSIPTVLNVMDLYPVLKYGGGLSREDRAARYMAIGTNLWLRNTSHRKRGRAPVALSLAAVEAEDEKIHKLREDLRGEQFFMRDIVYVTNVQRSGGKDRFRPEEFYGGLQNLADEHDDVSLTNIHAPEPSEKDTRIPEHKREQEQKIEAFKADVAKNIVSSPEGSLMFMRGHGLPNQIVYSPASNFSSPDEPPIIRISFKPTEVADILYQRYQRLYPNGERPQKPDIMYLGNCYSTDFVFNVYSKLEEKLAATNTPAYLVIAGKTERGYLGHTAMEEGSDDYIEDPAFFQSDQLADVTLGDFMDKIHDSKLGKPAMFVIRNERNADPEMIQVAKRNQDTPELQKAA